MAAVTVLLALGPRLLCESLAHELRSQSDITVIPSEARGSPELLLEVKRERPDCLIVSCEETADIPGIFSHLFSEFPDLVIFSLSERSGEARVYRQDIVMEQIRDISVDSLVTALRSATNDWTSA